jgi:hypothetical protein
MNLQRNDADRRPGRPVYRPNDYAPDMEARLAASDRRLKALETKRIVLLSPEKDRPKLTIAEHNKTVQQMHAELREAQYCAVLTALKKSSNGLTIGECALVLNKHYKRAGVIMNTMFEAGFVDHAMVPMPVNGKYKRYFITPRGLVVLGVAR